MSRFLPPFRRERASRQADDELPLRAELFSAEQMEQHGRNLAAAHRLNPRPGPDQLLLRLAANEAVLLNAGRVLAAAVQAKRRISPAGEWLLDNLYLIEEQVRTARRHLPKDYSRGLPRLANGPSSGLPRVYDIALETIAHGDGRVDPATLGHFVAAYQSVAPIRLGELWAIPIMLRLALIENLRRVAADVAAGRVDRDLADRWVDQMRAVEQSDPKSLILVIADMARSNPPMTTAFVSELARRLQGHGPALALPLTWIEQRLAETNHTIEQLVQAGAQLQAANQVSVSNSIGSLRFLGAMDWRTFVESMSVVEATLLRDPDGTYATMDFGTRDRYRHAVERLAKAEELPEPDVAQRALDLARRAAATPGFDARAAHVGYWLIDDGLPALEQELVPRRSRVGAWRGLASRHATPLYLTGVLGLTVLFAAGLVAMAAVNPLPAATLWVIVVLSLVASSQLGVALLNWLLTLAIQPRSLPRLDYSDGIPDASRTLVVVPSLLTNPQGIDDLVEALEVRFLANRDANLHFALLTDFIDASEATLPGDGFLLRRAESGIAALNDKHRASGGGTGAVFHLLHRPRAWNARERAWMGHERKRGKLGDLNALLRGEPGAAQRYAATVGDTAALRGIRFVITLDSDTELPRDAARQLVGAIAHPLNRAHYDAAVGRVTHGHGILQPRVVPSLPGSNRSRYARLFGGEPGIDPYTRSVSDVYQDAFGEGSFVGKGIYDVEAFELALRHRFPENRILSHDLLEGSYARSGLVTDVQLVEDPPSRYSGDVARRHRWIRGDWQIAGWLLRRVPGPDGTRLPNPLTWLSQWKVLDNLRRSVVPAALLALLLIGWAMLARAWPWTLAVLFIVLVPPLVAALHDLLQRPRDVSLPLHLAYALRGTGRRGVQLAFTLACLPHEAAYSVGAILRTHWRMLVSGRRLLEWTPSSEIRGDPTTLAATYWSMAAGPVVAIGAAFALPAINPSALQVAAPWLLLWLLSPAFAWWLSLPSRPHVARLHPQDTVFLRKLARRTWSYFETFVAASDGWLPPDNLQEVPVATVAHRTSPTNMGMALLADLTAHDFGWLPAGRLAERLGNALDTMQRLDRHRGHFYNWYDTLTLRPLPPRYVSSVDSGNLAGHLLTLRSGLLALPDAPVVHPRTFDGLVDTARLLADALGADAPATMRELVRELAAVADAPPRTAVAIRACLDRLAQRIDALAPTGTAPRDGASILADEAVHWHGALVAQGRSARDDLVSCMPWLEDTPLDEVAATLPVFGGLPTLRELARPEWLETAMSALRGIDAANGGRVRSDELAPRVRLASERARARIAELERLADRCESFARMDASLLYDTARHLFAVGYNVDERHRGAGAYDLLASEARFSSFVAIAQGRVPQDSWFALGRLLTSAGARPILLSWSGSMFEYLMPMLVMPTYEHSLLDQTCRAAVERQIAYGRELGVPWGMSESGYNAVDAAGNYQYRAFGVPGIGLKRGLAEDVVVAPYASALALMVAPEAACANLQRLAAEGLAGRFGLYEAVDYTPSRVKRGERSAVVRSFMAHHQGMSLLALSHLLLAGPMQRRFESDPAFQATLLLLQERIPKPVALFSHVAQLTQVRANASDAEPPVRVIDTPDTPMPEVQLLSNGRYHVMVTQAGGGSSRWNDLAITRWREDATCDAWGTFCYVRDVASGAWWSTAHLPAGRKAEHYEAIFSEGRAEFRRRDQGLDLHTEIAVSPEDDIELRRTRIVNRSRTRRVVEFTSYAEIVLAPPAPDAIHPAFSNLFVQSEIVEETQSILFTRRPRSPGEH
ncbi:MAG: glucoamylase family protein, partial [Betaproteobacteria bacterium]